MKTLFLAFIFIGPFVSRADVCLPNVDSCAFYLCKEGQNSCGPQGYPLGFGFKFCSLFLNTEHHYSEPAHLWLRRVRVCLMENFPQSATENEQNTLTCGEVKDQGFSSHLGCYVKTGFCELSKVDQFQVSWAMKTSFVHPEALRDGFAVMKACTLK